MKATLVEVKARSEDHAHLRDILKSNVSLYRAPGNTDLEMTLTNAFGVLAAVDKIREIYFIGNVKFHLDDVKGLGSFMEIEAIDCDGSIGDTELALQCEKFRKLLGVNDADLLAGSYGDMVLER